MPVDDAEVKELSKPSGKKGKDEHDSTQTPEEKQLKIQKKASHPSDLEYFFF